jgi:hypothetical protein
LHKNGANRIIALKAGGLVADFRFFPQGFPLMCAKLNTREIFFCCASAKVVQPGYENCSCEDFDCRNSPMLE